MDIFEEPAQNTGYVIETSRAMREVMDIVTQIADSSTTVLITGESGVGKEFIAQTIHDQSSRKNKPFIKLNCAELPETILEAELFGCDRSITIRDFACRENGCLERAYGGTLFLDGVGAIIPLIQVKLLRVLENSEFERLGGAKTIRADARIIAATKFSLKEAVANKRFREDLYYRLNVININLLPLQERKEDIRYLAHHFLQMYSKRNDKTIKGISKEVRELFLQYNWPGNVQELENIIERAVVLTRNEYITLADIPNEIINAVEGINTVSVENKALTVENNVLNIPIGKLPLKEIERLVMEETLKQTNGNIPIAANLLGISTRTIYRRNDKEKFMTERPVVLTRNDYINPGDIPKEIAVGGINTVSLENKVLHIPIGKLPLKEIERMLIEETLTQCRGNVETAANLLGISTRTIYRRYDDEKIIESE